MSETETETERHSSPDPRLSNGIGDKEDAAWIKVCDPDACLDSIDASPAGALVYVLMAAVGSHGDGRRVAGFSFDPSSSVTA